MSGFEVKVELRDFGSGARTEEIWAVAAETPRQAVAEALANAPDVPKPLTAILRPLSQAHLDQLGVRSGSPRKVGDRYFPPVRAE